MIRVKLLLPTARIWFQSLLPIPANGNPHGECNVLYMNKLLFELCSKNKLLLIDVFSSFLNRFGNRDHNLFPKFNIEKNLWDIHPNSKGMGVLASHYIFLIHSKWFNPFGY